MKYAVLTGKYKFIHAQICRKNVSCFSIRVNWLQRIFFYIYFRVRYLVGIFGIAWVLLSKFLFLSWGGTTWTGDFKVMEVKTGFCRKNECKPVLLGLSLAWNLVKPLMSLYGTEWRERDYGLSIEMPKCSCIRRYFYSEPILPCCKKQQNTHSVNW